jgi:hypothetical protein
MIPITLPDGFAKNNTNSPDRAPDCRRDRPRPGQGAIGGKIDGETIDLDPPITATTRSRS